MTIRHHLAWIAFGALAAIATSCSGGSQAPSVTVFMAEASGGADLTIEEPATCNAATICLKVTWAAPPQGGQPLGRHVRLAGAVDNTWRVVWERDKTAPFNGGDGAFQIPLDVEGGDWLGRSGEAVLSVTQTDAPPPGGGEPRVRVTSRPIGFPDGVATPSTVVGPRLDLSGAFLAAAWLAGLDLSGASLDGEDLRGAT